MVIAAGAFYFLVTSDEFDLGQAEVSADVRYADIEEMLAAVDLAPDDHPNVFEVRTEAARQALLAYPGIADAQVRAVLPNRVLVTLSERPPVLVLRRGGASYAVDGNGFVLAAVDDGAVAALGLPTIADDRVEWATPLEIGRALDSTDLAALLQLGALTPDAIGSGASALALTIDDVNGFVLAAEPRAWRAIFGHYTPTLRPADIVPRQVQCLRSLLAEGEPGLRTVYLAPQEERCGTFVQPTPRTPRNSPAPDPSA